MLQEYLKYQKITKKPNENLIQCFQLNLKKDIYIVLVELDVLLLGQTFRIQSKG